MSLTLTLPNVRTQVPSLRGQVNASGPVVAAALTTIQDAFDQIARNANGLQAGIDAKSTSTSTAAVAPLNATIDSITTAFTSPAVDGSRQVRATIGITPPGSGTWVGPHVWLEVPGSGGTFKQFDYGKLPYVPGVPLIIDHDVPAGAETWRYYVGAYSADIDNAMVRVGSVGATPSVTASVGPFSGTAGAEYCANVTGLSIALTFTNSDDGQLKRFIQVAFTAPSDSRYSGALIELVDTASPIHVLHSIPGAYTDGTVSSEEPAATTTWKVRVRAIGPLGTNSYVNGTTPEVSQSVGATTGTLDFRKALAASIASHLGMTSGVFGVLPGGITNALVAANAIDTVNLVNAAVGNNKIANFAVDAAKIANAAIQNAHFDRATAFKIAIVDADIVTLTANKLTAGSISATIAYLGTINANQVNAGTFNGIALVLNLNGITTSVNNATVAGVVAGLAVVNNSTGTLVIVGSTGMFCRVSVASSQVVSFSSNGVLAQNTGGFASVSLTQSGQYGALTLFNTTGSPMIKLNAINDGAIEANGSVVINSSRQYVGAGVLTPNFGHSASGFNPFDGFSQLFGQNYDLRWGVTITGNGFYAIGVSINNFASFASGVRVRGGVATALF